MTPRAVAALLAVLSLGSTACSRDPYMPQDWRQPTTIEEPSHLKSWLNMNDPKAPMQFVKDISEYVEGGAWRWTRKEPTVTLSAPGGSGVKFAAKIAVPEITMQHTGPVTIRVMLNGHELAQEHYDTPGDKRIEKPVPDGWLRTGESENVIAMQIDKMWVNPDNGRQYGFVLTTVGLTR